MKIFKVLLITLMLLANTAFAAEFSAQVKTSEGIVQGVYDEKYNVVKWFGIPYAQQANGEKRWALPQKAEKYTGVKDCSQYAPANLQLIIRPATAVYGWEKSLPKKLMQFMFLYNIV